MSTQQDIYAAGSENRPPMLNKENYVPWSSRLLRYAKSRPNGKLIYNSIMNDIYAAVDSCETAQEIWLRVQQMMKGSDIGIQEKKAKLFNEWERFTSTDGESIESYYHRFSKLMNDFKRNKHFPEKIASNLKFLNNLQPEWSRHVTIVHQTKDLHTTDYTQLYDFLKYNQKEVDDQRAERLAKTHDPLALMANSNNPFNYTVFHQDQPSPSTYMQQPQPINNNYNPQPSFNQNFMQQPIPNPEDITDPTTAMNMALALMAKAFKLNYSTPTNNNQRISSNPRNRQIAQPGMNMGQDRQMRMVGANGGNQFRQYAGQNVGYQNGYNAVQNVGNQVVQDAVQNQGVQNIEQHPANVEETRVLYDSLYNNLAIEVEKVNSVNRKLRETNANLTTKLARYKNQERCFDISQEKYDKLERCYQQSIYQEQCLSKKINALHLSSGKQITALNEEISNLSKQLSKKKSIVSSLQEEKKRLNSDFKIREDELLDKQIQLENKIKELDNILVKTEAAKFVRDFQSLAKEADESLAKHKALELEIERLLRAVVSQDIMSIVQNNSVRNTSNLQTKLEPQLEDQKGKSKDTQCVSNTLDHFYQNLENENVESEFQVLNYAKENTHLKTTYKSLFDSIKVTRAQTKAIIDSLQDKLHDTIYENAKLRAQLFDKVSEQNDTNKGTSVNTQFSKQSILGKPPSSSKPKLYYVTPFPKSTIIPKVGKSNALSKPVTSNSAPSSRKSTVVNNERVIAPGIFRINPFKASRVDNFVSNKHVKASVRIKPITVSQPYVITKNDVNSKTNGFSPKDVKSTTRTRRPQPKSDKVPSKSKSIWLSNKLEKIEENHRSLQSSNYPDHTSSECNNIKLAIQNAKYEVMC
ncbi:hypothetical protein Tco_1139903, partial [Tanacetum coccineum]